VQLVTRVTSFFYKKIIEREEREERKERGKSVQKKVLEIYVTRVTNGTKSASVLALSSDVIPKITSLLRHSTGPPPSPTTW
jgi:hypothetical protein